MNNEERIKALGELLAKDQNDAFSRYALALEYNSLGETDKAIDELQELIRRDPNYIAAYRQLGQLYAKMNKTREAKKYYRKGIELAEETNDSHAKREMEEELEEIEDEW
ncbi:MAG TPA: tetratricopeptide repeat protein [Bacteroidota bacterium]|nr:tetratricopeptide repeat protein [Bacteroidota bacterium]